MQIEEKKGLADKRKIIKLQQNSSYLSSSVQIMYIEHRYYVLINFFIYFQPISNFYQVFMNYSCKKKFSTQKFTISDELDKFQITVVQTLDWYYCKITIVNSAGLFIQDQYYNQCTILNY